MEVEGILYAGMYKERNMLFSRNVNLEQIGERRCGEQCVACDLWAE